VERSTNITNWAQIFRPMLDTLPNFGGGGRSWPNVAHVWASAAYETIFSRHVYGYCMWTLKMCFEVKSTQFIYISFISFHLFVFPLQYKSLIFCEYNYTSFAWIKFLYCSTLQLKKKEEKKRESELCFQSCSSNKIFIMS